LINPAIFADPYDLLAMRVAVKKARTFLSANAWKDYVIRPLYNLAAAFTSDDALDAYMREEAIGGAHPVGSAAMSPRGATWGVVDPDLLLKKASGIRIIDASVMVCSYRACFLCLNLTKSLDTAICAQLPHTGTNICHR
jgi:choline dehydrogenase-like flavoprotein